MTRLAPALLAFGILLPSGTARSEPALTVPLDIAPEFLEVAAPSLQIMCNSMCVSPCGGSGSQHLAQSWGAINTVNPHTDCKPFADCPGHPGCNNSRLSAPALERLGAVVSLVAEGHLGAVDALRAEFDDIAIYNRERAALQIVGCEADILTAHLPLTKRQLTVWLSGAE